MYRHGPKYLISLTRQLREMDTNTSSETSTLIILRLNNKASNYRANQISRRLRRH